MMLLTRRLAFSLASLVVPHTLENSVRTSIMLAAAPGITLSPLRDIQDALEQSNAVVVDARSVQEIVDNGYFAPPSQSARWVHAECTIDSCPLLEATATTLIGGNKKETPVVVYCASGKRAARAKKTLEQMGYRKVLNAGAFPEDTKLLSNTAVSGQ